MTDTGWFVGHDPEDSVYYPCLATKTHVLILPMKFGTQAEAALFLDNNVLGMGRAATDEVPDIEVPK